MHGAKPTLPVIVLTARGEVERPHRGARRRGGRLPGQAVLDGRARRPGPRAAARGDARARDHDPQRRHRSRPHHARGLPRRRAGPPVDDRVRAARRTCCAIAAACSHESRSSARCGATATTPGPTSSTSTWATCAASSATAEHAARRSSPSAPSATGSTMPASRRCAAACWLAAHGLGRGGHADLDHRIFIVVYRDTGSELRAEIDRDIAGDASQLAQSLWRSAGTTAAAIGGRRGRYVRAQPYRATSTLLFVIVPGAATASSHPELFGPAAPDDGEIADRAGAGERRSAAGCSCRGSATPCRPSPTSARSALFERSITVGDRRARRRRRAAGDRGPRAARRGARLRPRRGAHAGPRAARVLPGRSPRLGAPAPHGGGSGAGGCGRSRPADARVERQRPARCGCWRRSFNHMLDRLAEAFAGQREFVADASHELRTPLTVIRGQLEVLAADERPSAAEVRRVESLVQGEIARISRLVDDLLLLAQSEQQRLPPAGVDRPRAVRLGAVGRGRPDCRPRLPAWPVPPARCSPTPTGSPRRCATCSQRDRADRRGRWRGASRGRAGRARPHPLHRDRRRRRPAGRRARAGVRALPSHRSGAHARGGRRRPRARHRPRHRRGPRGQVRAGDAGAGVGARFEFEVPGFQAGRPVDAAGAVAHAAEL